MSGELRALVDATTQAAKGEPLLLTTLVRVRGSAYRRPGARMLSTPSRWLAGSISGGCLEADVVRRAFHRTREHRAVVVTYDATSDDDVESGFGLGCNGAVELLIERVDPSSATDPIAFIGSCLASETTGAIATVIRSSQAKIAVGARLTSRADGTMKADFEAGDLRDEFVGLARRVLGGRAGGIFQAGDGSLDVFVETIRPAPHLFVFGTGQDAAPVVELAHFVGWNVTVCSAEPRLVVRERFASSTRVLVGAPAQTVLELDRHCRPIAVVMSHHYERDKAALAALLESRALYIGVLGPKHRTGRMLAELETEGIHVADRELERLHAPLGLQIGAEGPREIALSIVAEIQAALSGTSGGRLRERFGPIHATEDAMTNDRIESAVMSTGSTT